MSREHMMADNQKFNEERVSKVLKDDVLPKTTAGQIDMMLGVEKNIKLKLSNYKTLPASETNTFTPGDTVICYDSEVSADPLVVEGVDGDKVLLRNYDMYVDFRTCRKLIKREPRVFYVHKHLKSVVSETDMKYENPDWFFKVIEVLED